MLYFLKINDIILWSLHLTKNTSITRQTLLMSSLLSRYGHSIHNNTNKRLFSAKAFAPRVADIQASAKLGGGLKAIDKQHAKHKLTARERLNLLLDKNSFQEIGSLVNHQCHDFGMENKHFWGDGVVAGKGYIGNRPVLVYSQDFTVHGGSLSESNAAKICKIQDMSMKLKIPVIGIGLGLDFFTSITNFIRLQPQFSSTKMLHILN